MSKLQFRVLYREFLFRMVDLEVLSAHAMGDLNKLFGQFAALLLFFSLWLGLAGFGFAGSHMSPPASLAFTLVTAHFLIATTMLVVGLFAVLSWDSTFPDRRDVLVLAPLPVRARTMFLAKVAAVATALGLTVALLHAFTGLIWPGAFAAQATPRTVPAFRFDPTPAAVSAGSLQPVLSRDLRQRLTTGNLAPATGAGLAVGAWTHGEASAFAYGTAKPDSLFEIGSITKTFTGLILAQMIVQHKVTIDEPVRLLLPPGAVSKPRGDEITVLDLVTQHSDLPHTVAEDWLEYLSRRGVGRQPQPPFLYSNFNFGLLGQLLAGRAGLAYSDLLQEQVTSPLGLTETAISLSPAQEARLIQGYDANHRPVPPDQPGLAGSGAIRSTAGDMLKYLAANLHPERLSGTLPEAIAMSHRPRAEGPPGTMIGFAWWYNPANGTWMHGGAMHGYTSYALFSPKGDFAAVVLLNRGPDMAAFPELLSEHIRQRLAGEPAISLDDAFVPATRNLLRWYGAYWFTMLAAGVFIYCGVLGLQGVAAQLLPRRLFLRVSGVLQMAAFCVFLLVYFLQPVFGEMADLWKPQTWSVIRWLPSYWFLALFQQLNGSMHPALIPLARRAWTGLAIVLGTAAAAYTLSYLRTLRKIVEEPDITPGSRRFAWLPPFGSRVQTAMGQFTMRTLMRSRQHRVILAFYLGIGFALTIFLLKAPEMRSQSPEANTPLLAASFIMMVLALVGTRVVFALPLDLPANWIFRAAGVRPGPASLTASRRALLLLSATPIWLGSAAVCLRLWPWKQAAGHLVLLGLTGILLADLCLHNFRKIPFTCSYLPGKSQVHMVFLGGLALMYFVMFSVRRERQVLEEPRGMLAMLAVFGALAIAGRFATAFLDKQQEEELQFEEEPAPAIQELGLHRDGVMPVG